MWKNTIKKNDMESYEREQLRQDIDYDSRDDAGLDPRGLSEKETMEELLDDLRVLIGDALSQLRGADGTEQEGGRSKAIGKLNIALEMLAEV
tara:strand:+ start:250 stop:525 length:276 start_codon:yes stop_codon:yes gene_type:complete